MDDKKSYIPFKLFIGYAIFAALLTGVTLLLFSENATFSATEKNIASENSKILKINALLSKVYESESLSRIALQSTSEQDYNAFTLHSSLITKQIDSLKILVQSGYQVQLLDSVKLLLARKKLNIDALREIKNRAGNEVRVTTAINEISRMQNSLRKLQLEDFVKNPAQLGAYQRNVLRKYVAYLNQNIPDDETNTLSQSVLDSLLIASRTLLNDVKRETSNRNRLLNIEEKKLLDNELLISSQLQKILNEIEREIIVNTSKNNLEKTSALNRIIKIITGAAVVGLALAFLFSLLILNDFLKTKKYKKWLQVANAKSTSLLKSREQLIATVSHDLKTPLSTISGYTELLQQAELTKKQHYYNSNIKSASDYISHLVQDLVDFTQIEAGKIVIDQIPFSLPDIITEVAHNVESVHRNKKIKLVVKTDPLFEKRIIGDPFRVRQILTNLIGNAYKFTSDGQINISATHIGDLIFVRVSDSGIGIAPEKLQIIFDEFTQADDSIEKRFGGTGLGLTISRKMAEILGGSLEVESIENEGSTFTLVLPFNRDESPQQLVELPENLKIVVVDDDRNLLNLTTEILTREKHIVFPYDSPKKALADETIQNADLFLTDLQMPEINGIEFLAQLKQKLWFDKPIIAITGKAEINEKEYKALGFAAVIRKPYAPKELISAISSVMQNQGFSAVEHDTKAEIPLARLRGFFPDDKEMIRKIVSDFIIDSQSNLKFLQNAIALQDISEIQMIAHRMSPMFLQLGIVTCGELLSKLENMDLNNEEIQQIFISFETEMYCAFAKLKAELVL